MYFYSGCIHLVKKISHTFVNQRNAQNFIVSTLQSFFLCYGNTYIHKVHCKHIVNHKSLLNRPLYFMSDKYVCQVLK